MSMYLHTPVLEVGSWWRVDTASGSDTATTVYAHDGTDAIPTGLGASGSTVRNTRVDGTALFWSSAATLYCKELTYQGVPNGTVVTSTGATPTTPGGAGTGGPVLGGPNVWTGTQDFTGATVTGVSGGGAASLLDRGNWASSTLYAVGDVTTQTGQRYAARVAHTSGTFATDLAASKWVALDTVQAIASGAAAGGDLSGTLPSPTVAKINGVAVSGTPTSGQVPTATSGSAATWQTPGDRLGLTPTAVKTSAYAAAAGDFVPVDTTSGNVTVTFPTAPADGTVIAVKHAVQGGTNTVSLALGGSDKFNTATGTTTRTLTLVSQALLAQYKSSSAIWYVIADDLPLSGLDTRYGPVVGSDAWLTLHAAGDLDALIVGAVTRDANGAATSAPVVWPDGTGGTYTGTTVSAAFLGAVDAYTVTYTGGTTRTLSQSAVTRDATTGAITNRPAMTVA